ncbi:uncharacterized protein METZ01_LOCUS284389 [marine metagenome]|uniref:Uncharacterized protein n=1 Tax=marine metagenome TaxID=408172 RepID=A0A382L6V0_9ZZZZ
MGYRNTMVDLCTVNVVGNIVDEID